MGCISTPMPNHLSTRLFFTTHLLMSGGVWKRCGKGRSVEMVRMRWCVDKVK